MKKRIVALLLTLLVLASCNVMVLADETSGSDGFYNIGVAEGVSVVPYVGDAAAAVYEQDVDQDGAVDTWYKDSERMEVSSIAVSDDGYYGVILVEGNDLPTKDNTIFYVDQLSPVDGVVNFNVYPILPEVTSELTLYISSNEEGFDLVKIPLGYAVNVAELPSYTLGDVDNDGVYGVKDALIVLQIGVGKYPATAAEMAAADVDGDGICGVKDALLILQYGTGKISSFK